MLKERDIVVCIILTFITCGIYGIIWFINLSDDIAYVSGDESIGGAKSFLFTLITCGIYYFYWCYKIGTLSYQAKKNKGLIGGDNSVLYLVLAVLGLGIVNYCLIQSDINDLSKIDAQA